MSHWERAPECEEGARGEDVAPLALLPQLLEREVHAFPQLRTPRRISVREDAGAVLSKELIVCRVLPWFQHFTALVPVDCAKRGVDSLGWVASIAQVAGQIGVGRTGFTVDLECEICCE